MILYVILVVVLLSVLWVLLVNIIMNPMIRKAKKKESNPYIMYHEMRSLNDQHYEDYLKWMDKHNKGLPVEKILTKEEWEFEQQLKKSTFN